MVAEIGPKTFGTFEKQATGHCCLRSSYIERFHSRGQQPYWITETKESICIKGEFNSRRISLVHHHGRHFFVLEHQHGRRDVMCKRSIWDYILEKQIHIE